MKNIQKGFIVPLILIIVALAIVGGLYWSQQKSPNSQVVTATSTTQTSQTTTSNPYQGDHIETKLVLPLKINSLSPAFGPEGTTVTIHGQGFTTKDNTVSFGGGLISGLNASSDGMSLTFLVSACPPSAPRCPAHMILGPAKVFVMNSNGISNSLTFIVGNSGQ